MQLHWFGQSWGAPINDEAPHQDTPVGGTCLRCKQPIETQDQGVTMMSFGLDWEATRTASHLDCFMRSITGKWPVHETHRRFTYEANETQEQRVSHLRRKLEVTDR